MTDWHATNSPSWRSAPTYSFDEALTWQKGKHSLSFGGGLLIANVCENAQQIVPGVNLGFNSTLDPAARDVQHDELPGRFERRADDARALYAMLTGRVSSITGQAALDPATNKYVAFGPRTRQGKHPDDLGLRAGLVAHVADPDPHRRHPLGHAVGVLAVERHHVERDDGGLLRHLGPWRRRHLLAL